MKTKNGDVPDSGYGEAKSNICWKAISRLLALVCDPIKLVKIGKALPLLAVLIMECGDGDTCRISYRDVSAKCNGTGEQIMEWSEELEEEDLIKRVSHDASGMVIQLLGDMVDSPSVSGSTTKMTGDLGRRSIESPYLTTEKAAAYLNRGVSWMLHQKDIPYYRGKPNQYRREDLDAWMQENRRHEPLVV